MDNTMESPNNLPCTLQTENVVFSHSRLEMTLWLICTDLFSLVIAGNLAVLSREWMGSDFSSPEKYYALSPLLLLFTAAYALVGLYPGVGIDPVHEIRSLFYASSIVTLLFTLITFLTQSGERFSRLIFLFFWIMVLVIVSIGRFIAKKIAVYLHIWGEPVALIGFGTQGQHIYEFLKKNPSYGIRPVVIVNGADIEKGDCDLPEISATTLAKDKLILSRSGIKSAIIAPNEIPAVLRDALIDEQKYGLDRLILVSSLKWIGGSAVIPHDMGGLLGLEVEQNLLHLRQRVVKRLLDICIMLALCIIVFPIMLFFSVLIRLDSPGPVFYRQRRVGKDGRELSVWKFRTMVSNADEILEKYLTENPSLREEWETTHKLKNDPRITRVGRILRKTSADELPQLINVLQGNMSVVGPRPIVQDEVKFYKDGYKLYTQVLPGITGLWQVSGRSDTSYKYRVSLDEYYIRHWSIWMDLYILFRTFWVVIKRNGAY